MTYELFEEDAKSTIFCLKEFVHQIENMGLNDVNDVRLQLVCLKNQLKFLLQSKWNFEKHLLPFICEDVTTNKHLISGQVIIFYNHIILDYYKYMYVCMYYICKRKIL